MLTRATRTASILAIVALSTDAISFDVEQALRNTAAHLNQSTPRPIGNDAYFEGAVAYERTLKYRFSFRKLQKDQISSEFALKQTEFLTHFVCATPEMQVFVENDVTLKYAYHDKHGKLVVLIAVEPGSCASE